MTAVLVVIHLTESPVSFTFRTTGPWSGKESSRPSVSWLGTVEPAAEKLEGIVFWRELRQIALIFFIPSFQLDVVLQQKLWPPSKSAVLADGPKIVFIKKGCSQVFQFIFAAVCSFVLLVGACLKISHSRHQRFKKMCGREEKKKKQRKLKVRKFYPSTF